MTRAPDKVFATEGININDRMLAMRDYFVLRGSNIYLPKTAIVHDFEFGELRGMSTSALGEEFVRCLQDRFLALEVSTDSCFSEVFVQRLYSNAGVDIAEVLLEAILTIESAVAYTMRNTDFSCVGRVVPADSGPRLVWECAVSRMSRQAATLACEAINESLWIAAGSAATRKTDESHFATGLRRLLKAARRRQRSLDAGAISISAQHRDVPCEVIANSYLVLGHGIAQRVIHSSYNGNGSGSGKNFAGESFPPQENTDSSVTPLSDMPNGPDRPGDQLHRLLVVDNMLVGALRIEPPALQGDGVHSVATLIEQHNRQAARQGIHQFPIPLDIRLDDFLAAQKLGPDVVPASGQRLELAYIDSIESGALHIDIADELHSAYRKAALAAVRRRSLFTAAIDIRTPDITLPPGRRRIRIVNVNATPALWPYVWPHAGRSRDVASGILDSLWAPNCSGRVPVLLVAGQHGTGRIARATEHLLRNNGAMTALALKRKSLVNGKVVDHDLSLRRNAMRDLLHRHETEVLIGTTSYTTLVRRGLGLQSIDAVVILDPEPGQDMEVYGCAIETLRRATTGIFIVSALNHPAHELLQDVPRQRIILVSHNLRNTYLDQQRQQGGLALIKIEEAAHNFVAIVEGGVIVSSEQVVKIPSSTESAIAAADQMFSLALAYAAGLRPPESCDLEGARVATTLTSARRVME